MLLARRSFTIAVCVVLLTGLLAAPLAAHPEHDGTGEERDRAPGDAPLSVESPAGPTQCVDGHAGEYECDNVDLLSFVPLSQVGGGNGNDL